MRPDSPSPRTLFAAIALAAFATVALAASYAGTRHANRVSEPPAQPAARVSAPRSIPTVAIRVPNGSKALASTPLVAAKPSPARGASYGAAGSMISIDPATGQRTMPSPEARRAAAIPELDRSMRGLRVEHRPDGSRRVDLQGRFQEYMVLEITPEGRKMERCVDAAELRTMIAPAAAPMAEPPALAGEGR